VCWGEVIDPSSVRPARGVAPGYRHCNGLVLPRFALLEPVLASEGRRSMCRN